MKVTYNWLKDFVEIKLKPQDLAGKLTMAGIEVTSLEKSYDDWVFEMEITSNRPDWLSVIGIAREVAAITGKKLAHYKSTQAKLAKQDNELNIKIEDKKACPLYTARLIAGVKVGSSPEWIQKRLSAVGLRPVNNIVDIANYVLMETGQPLHAFDFDKLVDKTIIVRRAKDGEKMTAIDGTELKLDSSVLVIADSQRPIAAAGIMGGVQTEVSKSTKNILLESAYFDPIITRRAVRKLGIASESSYRFERSVDLLGIKPASKRACDLICELAGGKEEGFKSLPAQIKLQTRKIQANTNRINKILGTDIQPSSIKKILENLGFNVKSKTKDNILVSIPSFRQDINPVRSSALQSATSNGVKEEADLTEEVARLFGYDKITSTLPYIKGKNIKAKETELNSTIRDILIKLGLNEVVTFALINRQSLDNLNFKTASLISIKNPLSQDQEILRPTLLGSMLGCIASNIKYNTKDIRIFEISHIFNDTKEPTAISIALTGDKPSSWQDASQRKLDFFDLKGLIETLLLELGVSPAPRNASPFRMRSGVKNFAFEVTDKPYFSDCASAALKVGNVLAGVLGSVNDKVLDKWDLTRREIFLAEVYLDKLLPFINLSQSYAPVNRFPKILRNVSLVVPKGVSFSAIKKCIQKNASNLLKDIQVVEQYKGEHIEEGAYGLTLLLVYQAEDHTLTDEEINSQHSKICDSFIRELQVKIR